MTNKQETRTPTRRGEIGCCNCDGPCMGCWEDPPVCNCPAGCFVHHNPRVTYAPGFAESLAEHKGRESEDARSAAVRP